MPIEIRELHIKVTVGDEGEEQPRQQREGAPGKEKIIRECVEQVLEALNKQKER
jgi:hypothetical protein